MSVFRLFLFLQAVFSAAGFSARTTTTPPAPWQRVLGIFSSEDPRLDELKNELKAECGQSIGRNTPEIRRRIESITAELATLNPTSDAATSPLLRRRWVLEWTSEKEINFFLEQGISTEITQTLDGDSLENYIPFVKGGGFGVTGQISVDEERAGRSRTNFNFVNANLDLGKWGAYDFPPVGKGWFDTIYLDEGKTRLILLDLSIHHSRL